MPSTRIPPGTPLPDDHPLSHGAMIVSVGRPLTGEADGDPGVEELRSQVEKLLPDGCTLVRAFGIETMGMGIWAAKCAEGGPLHRYDVGSTACWGRWPALKFALEALESRADDAGLSHEDSPKVEKPKPEQ